MKPIAFPQSNKTLLPPQGMEEECGDLPVYTNGRMCVSLWELTEEEKKELAENGRIWVFVVSGQTQPPIALSVDKNIFDEKPSMKYWQHGETGNVANSISQPSERWLEITKEQYEAHG